MARQDRMDRNQFFQKLGEKTEDDLRKVLWELYWRGKAEVRTRIEDLLDPTAASKAKKASQELDGAWVLQDIQDFAALIRSGAYMGGTRAVTRQERSKWRVTFRKHMEDATSLLGQGEPVAWASGLHRFCREDWLGQAMNVREEAAYFAVSNTWLRTMLSVDQGAGLPPRYLANHSRWAL